MKNIIDLYEASLLDIEGSIEDGNKYENVDLEMIMKAKSKEEFNILYDILKDTIAAEEKEPPTKTRYKKKRITSGDDNLYIKFQIDYGNYGEKKSITIGGEKTVNFTWNIFLDKVFVGNYFSKFSEVDLTNCECVRYLPKKWYKQAQKIIKSIK
jgi:hypothetical protein